MSGGRRLMFWGVMLVGTVASAEAIVRLTLAPPGLLKQGDDAHVLLVNAPMGYALAPGARGKITAGGHEAAIQINAWGFRDGPFDAAASADVRVLGVGDSFTMGLGVDSTDPWPQQLEQVLRRETTASVRVVNAGVPGYSTRQMRQMMTDVAPDLRPQVVVFAVAGENFWRVERPYVFLDGYLVRSDAMPELQFGRNGAYYSPITRWGWLHDADLWMNQHFQLGAQLLSAAFRIYGKVVPQAPVSTPDYPPIEAAEAEARLLPTMAEIGQADSLARAGGYALVVLLVNSQREDGEFDEDQFTYNRVLRGYCDARQIRVVDPLPVLAGQAAGRPIFRNVDDYHWTRAAHQLVAEELGRYLTASGLLPAVRSGPPR